MRPRDLDDFVGQRHFMYKDSLLYNAIKRHTFESAVFFGPSGTGKTTLARIIAGEMDADFTEINASETGIKELKALIENAKVKFSDCKSSRPTYTSTSFTGGTSFSRTPC
jgi:putative ATPase